MIRKLSIILYSFSCLGAGAFMYDMGWHEPIEFAALVIVGALAIVLVAYLYDKEGFFK